MNILKVIEVFGFEVNDVLFYVLLGVGILLVLFLIGVIGSAIEKKKKNKKA